MEPRNLLLVSYHYPPMGGSGVQRAMKLAAYLPAFGWRAHVLTSGHTHYPLLDPTLLEQTKHPSDVHRVRGWEPGAVAASICRQLWPRGSGDERKGSIEDRLYWRLDAVCSKLRLPETEALWLPAAIREARRLVAKHDIAAVVTTSPPHMSHLVGMEIRRRLNVPWIADLRDPILDNFAYSPRSRLKDRFWRWLEGAIVRRADHVVVTCPELADRLAQRYGELLSRKITTITNGYDPVDSPHCQRSETVEKVETAETSKRFVLSHVGAFYRQQSIGPILAAIRLLHSSRDDIAKSIDFRVVGSISANQRRLIQAGDREYLREVGYLPHHQAVGEMSTADALILMTPENEGGRYCIPAKAFEYLAFGKHIIGLVHADTAMERLLAAAGNATIVPGRDPIVLARSIEQCFDAWRSGTLGRDRDETVLRAYRRDCLAGRYAQVVEHCVDDRAMLRIAENSRTEEAAA